MAAVLGMIVEASACAHGPTYSVYSTHEDSRHIYSISDNTCDHIIYNRS